MSCPALCGLFASIGFAPDQRRIDIVAHRGPDGAGWETLESAAGPVALGHRRLAIVGLGPGGAQPMADPTGRYSLVFNGEIYNYIELRQELAAAGEIFHTDTDSEVLLRAFAVWGDACLARLRGMFAFVLWDRKHERLFAARDRFGIKPLYYVETPGGLALGSEIKQLVGLTGLTGRMNIARVHDFLLSGMSDHTAETMFAGVRQLRGGECLIREAREPGGACRISRWYPVATAYTALPLEDASRRFRDGLTEAVRIHMRSDVPLGSCLSGGLDSSSIVSLMRQVDPATDLHTISACYDEASVDEKPFIDAVNTHVSATPHLVYPRAEDLIADAQRLTWHQDEPFGSTSIYAQWAVFSRARAAGLKVMLDGQGADEQLAGYHFLFGAHLAERLKRGDLAGLMSTLRGRARDHGAGLPGQIVRLLAALAPPALRRQGARLGGRGEEWLGGALTAREGNAEGAAHTAAAGLGLDRAATIGDLCRQMVHASNLQMLLHWEDRNSMAHSIEARVPFLDHPLVEFSLGLASDHKIVGSETKVVLRRAMRGILPPKIEQRSDKLGFATPETQWFRGPLRAYIHEGSERTLALYPDLFDRAAVRQMRDAMLDGRRPVDFRLWRVVSLGLWGDCFSVSY